MHVVALTVLGIARTLSRCMCIALLCFAIEAQAFEVGDEIGIIEGHGALPSGDTDFGQKVAPEEELLLAKFVIERGLSSMGLLSNYTIVFSSQGRNAKAAVREGGSRRLIFVDSDWAINLNRRYQSTAPLVSLLAHEIAHHLNNDPLTGSTTEEKELAADKFAGRLMAEIGYFRIDAKAFLTVSEELFPGSASAAPGYPDANTRMNAIEESFTRACILSGRSCDIRFREDPASARANEGQIFASYAREYIDRVTIEANENGEDVDEKLAEICADLPTSLTAPTRLCQ